MTSDGFVIGVTIFNAIGLTLAIVQHVSLRRPKETER
jgi:hypothetical protein